MFIPQQLEASSQDEDNQEPPSHQTGPSAKDNRIAMAQYECFQRVVKESHRKTQVAGETGWRYWGGESC